jgi:hypothetical protein
MRLRCWVSIFAILPAVVLVVQAQSFDYAITSAESVLLMDAKTEIPDIGQLRRLGGVCNSDDVPR